MKMIEKIDTKVINFLMRICRYYLRKRKVKNSFTYVSSPDKIQTHIMPYINSESSINYIDIGAHKGNIVDDLSKYYTFNKVILAEPVAYLADILREKFSSKGYMIYQNIISDVQSDSNDFYINELSGTSSLLEFKSHMKELSNVNTKLKEVQRLPSRTLDDIVEECELTNIDLIKIDVQGAEHLVIKGAKNTLGKTKFIWVELSFKPLYENSSVFGDIYSQLEKENFILLDVSETHRGPKNELLQIDALFGNKTYIN